MALYLGNKRVKINIPQYVTVSNMDELCEAITGTIKTIFLEPGLYTLTDEHLNSNGDSPLTINGYNLVGVGSSEDVIIDIGAHKVKELGGIVLNNAILRNLKIENNTSSSVYTVRVGSGSVILDGVSIINNGTKSAFNIDGHLVENMEATISNCNFENTKSSNSYSPIVVRGSVLTMTDYCKTVSVNDKSPSITVDYGDGDTKASEINIDDTLFSKRNTIDGIIIYSAAPNSVYIDTVNVNGITLSHNDDTKQGGNSTIVGWKAFDADDWDKSLGSIPIINYDGYIYTNNQDLNPNDYLS